MAEQTEIAYEGKEWKSYQTGGTLVRATDLNNMEQGIADACNGVDELRTKRLPTYVVAQDGDTATQDVYTEPILGPCLILDLATRTTYYETGGDEEGHRKAITSGDDIDDLRDSLSQAVLMSEGVGKCLISRIDGQPVRMSTYDEAGDNGVMIIYGDNGIVMYNVETQTTMHKASWDFQLSLSQLMAKLAFAMSIKSVGFYSREEPSGSGTYVLELNVVRTDEKVVNVQFIPGKDVLISNR